MTISKIKKTIINWLNSYVDNYPVNGFIIGVSGGIDSGVVSALCAETGKPTLVLEMPIHQESEQVSTSSLHVKYLKNKYKNVTSKKINLTKSFEQLEKTLKITGNYKDLAMANTRSRLRMTTLYAFANAMGYVVVGTGNKVEDYGIKFFTKYGDGGVDISPIGDLLKSEVYKLGKSLKLIPEILNAIPTDGLWEDSPSDEDQIGASYDELEFAMDNMETSDEFLSERQLEVKEIFMKRFIAGQHKMRMPPICRLLE